ncbi:MAG TPA: GAF domain-containing protein [Ignavibacteria bacterium]|nr:GAF domain-containing protein [Ignavibacteria bacterium]HRF66169.1 GAF domain-containing protein [Ignavibacteria bacterium]HRJ03455.1 GAF domain-containing protein [Ignavibacteria bacterium]HRJ84038.1 GAF domain-containing protein [Ignavibacteria bacterium]
MSTEIKISVNLTKAERYEQLLPQIKALIAEESDVVANLANICAVLKYNMPGFFWVGFYLLKGGELVLGPFQGPVACMRIQIGKGVCGAAAQRRETIIVPDVDKFPGHFACSSLSKSEIVIPLFNGSEVAGLLDVDSDELSMFDEIDQRYLEELCKLISL